MSIKLPPHSIQDAADGIGTDYLQNTIGTKAGADPDALPCMLPRSRGLMSMVAGQALQLSTPSGLKGT